MDNWITEPSLQVLNTTDFGAQPQGSCGVRYEWDRAAQAVFVRGTVSKKIPTLMDRYVRGPDFVGNPNLKIETDWTLLAGFELKKRKWAVHTEAYTQLKQDARVYSNNTIENFNGGSIMAVTGTGEARIFHEMEAVGSATVARSFLPTLNSSFPYVPDFQTLTGVRFFDRKERPHWLGSWMGRWAGPQVGSSQMRVPSFLVWDAGMQVDLGKGLSGGVRVENAFDRSIEVIRGYPLGRIVSLTLGAVID
jgi:outer membrane cobalamin receptor